LKMADGALDAFGGVCGTYRAGLMCCWVHGWAATWGSGGDAVLTTWDWCLWKGDFENDGDATCDVSHDNSIEAIVCDRLVVRWS